MIFRCSKCWQKPCVCPLSQSEGAQAVIFAVELEDHFDRLCFLEGWLRGDTSAWPEYVSGGSSH